MTASWTPQFQVMLLPAVFQYWLAPCGAQSPGADQIGFADCVNVTYGGPTIRALNDHTGRGHLRGDLLRHDRQQQP
jgi:hypothetical protein